jgi:hypothetical protein
VVEHLGLLLACIPGTYLALCAIGLGAAGVALALIVAAAGVVAHDAASEPMPSRYRDIIWRAGIHAGSLLAMMIPALLATEALTGKGGLGTLIRRALRSGDLEGLMMAALAVAAAGLAAATIAAAAAVYRPPTESATPLTWPSRLRVGIAAAPAVLLALLALGGPFIGLSSLAPMLRALVVSMLVVTAVAALVGLTLGFLAALVTRSADVLLARAYEVRSALPSALITGALLTLGGGVGLLVLGILRGVEIAFLFRSRLAQGRQALGLESISLGRTPILPHLSRLLPAAARQPLSSLFLTGSWLLGLELSAFALGVRPPEALAPLGNPAGPAGSLAALAMTLVAVALYALLADAEADDAPEAPVLALNRRVSRHSSTPPG